MTEAETTTTSPPEEPLGPPRVDTLDALCRPPNIGMSESGTVDIMERIDALSENFPEAITMVSLGPEDGLATPHYMYKGMWHMYFANKIWFRMGQRRFELQKLFPAFVAVEMNSPFTRLQNTQSQELLHRLFQVNYLVLPFLTFKKDQDTTKGPKVEFVGFKFNYNGNSSDGVRINYTGVKPVAMGVYGVWRDMGPDKNLKALHRPIVTSRQREHFENVQLAVDEQLSELLFQIKGEM